MMRVGAFLRRCRQKVANAGVHDGPCDGARDLWFVVQVCAHVEYRADYLKILNNVHVSKKRREEVSQVIKQLLEDNGYA